MALTCDDLVVGKCYKTAENIEYGPRAGTYLGKFIKKELRGSGDDRVDEADFSNKTRVICNKRDGDPYTFEEVECSSENKTKAGGKRKTRRAQRKRRTTRARK
jgi:hypothetical protein